MFREAVILVGGLGTRLSHILGNVPKPMAPVYGKPFLTYVLDRLIDAGITHAVLATGHMHEVIENYFHQQYRSLTLSYSRETTPLFTGGAILKAAQQISSDNFLVLNGDTLFDIDYVRLYELHQSSASPITLALRHVSDAGRYGAVELTDTTITAFREKDPLTQDGLINGGIYAISRQWLLAQPLPEKFSFEKDLLQHTPNLSGMVFDNYFIDIGIPEDYHRAQREFSSISPKDKHLYLDRDGVLNRHIWGDYVRSWDMWEWMPNVPSALATLAPLFSPIILVSNQQGVGLGLFSNHDLEQIHANMLHDIRQAGGRIDAIYTCTDIASSHSPNRKPDIGMALQSLEDFPQIDFHRAIMVGDSLTDMQFGYKAQMRCIYLSNNDPIPDEIRDYTDLILTDLPSLTNASI